MKTNAESIIKSTIQQEKQLLLILNNLKNRKFTLIERKVIQDLQHTSLKNINLLEKNFTGLIEKLKIIPFTNLMLDDFNVNIPKTGGFNYQTNLIFIMRIIDNFIRLFTIMLRKCDEDLLRQMFERLIEEKNKLKQRIESIYDQTISNGK